MRIPAFVATLAGFLVYRGAVLAAAVIFDVATRNNR
jgi:ABC-type xylose transport system permease subunit